jgi:heme exporter protein B
MTVGATRVLACEGCARRRKNETAVEFLRHAAAMAWKDLRVEFRSREILYTMTFFAAMVVLIFSFAFVREDSISADVVPGILWVAVAFSGTLGLSRAFDREREGDTMRGLLLAPTSRTAIFAGKAVGVAVFMTLVELVVVPLAWVLFGSPMFRDPLPLVLLFLLANVGFAVVGSVFAAMLLRSRSRDVLLPVVLYPIVVPLLIAGTKGTAALLQPVPDLAVAYFWIQFLVVFDAAFLVASLWTFESLVIE